jgi:hypothetical protein
MTGMSQRQTLPVASNAISTRGRTDRNQERLPGSGMATNGALPIVRSAVACRLSRGERANVGFSRRD